MGAEDDGKAGAAWWRGVLALGLTLWLAGFWLWSDAITHRFALLALVLPGVILNRQKLRRILKEKT